MEENKDLAEYALEYAGDNGKICDYAEVRLEANHSDMILFINGKMHMGNLPIELTTEQWMEFDLPFLQSAHTLYVLCTMNWDKSEGVVAEINYAKDNSKKIEYIEPTPFVLYGEDIDC